MPTKCNETGIILVSKRLTSWQTLVLTTTISMWDMRLPIRPPIISCGWDLITTLIGFYLRTPTLYSLLIGQSVSVPHSSRSIALMKNYLSLPSYSAMALFCWKLFPKITNKLAWVTRQLSSKSQGYLTWANLRLIKAVTMHAETISELLSRAKMIKMTALKKLIGS